MHTLTFSVPNAWVDAFTDGMEDGATAVTARVDEHAAQQEIIAYYETPPAAGELQSRLGILAQMAGIPVPESHWVHVPDTDWLSAVYQGLHPLRLGRFYVHGSHSPEPPPAGSISILVDAATAFGSGHHATTAACLLALSEVSRNTSPTRALDLGCGSGILAIGMAKLWRKKTIAMDIDPEAVRVTRTNAQLNGCSGFIQTAMGGTDHAAFQRHAPYDVMMANILARPLTLMAAQISDALSPTGTLILSGLLTSQETLVQNAYLAQGLRLSQSIRREGWSALVMKR